MQGSGRLADIAAVAYELAEQGAMDDEEEEWQQLMQQSPDGERILPPLPPLVEAYTLERRPPTRTPSARTRTQTQAAGAVDEGPIPSVDGERLEDEQPIVATQQKQLQFAKPLGFLKRAGKKYRASAHSGAKGRGSHESDDESSESSRDDELNDAAANQNALRQLELKYSRLLYSTILVQVVTLQYSI